MNKRVCNGWCTVRNKFTEEERQKIIDLLPTVREKFIKEYSERNDDLQLFCGHRFKDDTDVVIRMESARERQGDLTLEEFIFDALYDCASSDYYYSFEKDWGDSDEYYTDEEGVDDDE